MADPNDPAMARTGSSRTDRAWIGVAGLMAVYVLPLFFAPEGRSAVLSDLETPWSARLFPGVPGGWVLGRLGALALAALIAARVTLRRVWHVGAGIPVFAVAPSVARMAVAAALTLLVCGLALGAARLGRGLQALYLLALFAPGCLLAASSWRSGRASAASRAVLPVALVAAAWLSWRGALGWHSTRLADPVDTWLGFGDLASALSEGRNVLVEGSFPGLTSVYLVFQGLFAFDAGLLPLGVTGVQLHQLGWLALAALGVGWIALEWLGRGPALVATAALLFSPFVLFLPLNPSPTFVGPVLASGLLVTLTRLHRRRSVAALFVLAPLAGLGLGMPLLAPLAAVCLVLAALTLRRGRDVPAACLVLAALLCGAAVLPGLSRLGGLSDLAGLFVAREGAWVGLEWMAMGQASPHLATAIWRAGDAHWLDVPVGALLAPFAVARTPVRLWGDAWLDPLGAALAALGLALCIRRAGRDAFPTGLLCALAAGLLPGFLTSYDRPSHTRMGAAAVPLALLAGVGFEALRRGLAPRLRPGIAAACGALAVAAGGVLLFDVVNPRILARSSLALGLEAIAPGPPPGGALFLEHSVEPGGFALDWLQVRPIATFVPRVPIPVRAYAGSGSLVASADGERPAAELILWSPALEADARVARGVCERWPGAALYRFSDFAGLSHAYAARPAGGGWVPALPPAQWQVEGCGVRP